MKEVFNVAYIHNFFGISNDTKFVRLEDYQELEKEYTALKEKFDKVRTCINCKYLSICYDNTIWIGNKYEKCQDKDKWEMC